VRRTTARIASRYGACSPAWTSAAWHEPCAVADALAAYEGWHPAVTEMVGAVSEGSRWALHDHAPLARWTAGRIVLIGDAAHAVHGYDVRDPRAAAAA
jgi:2-polyprenyl-6-methoxyphenol hydroxylase-like FAD-dependent oxidoreductase